MVALLYLGGLLLSRHRPRTTVVIGAVLAANALLVALVLSIGRQLFVNQLTGTVFGPASTVFYDTLLSYLERGQRVMLWLGLILVAIGWFAGRTRLGTATRTATTGALESVGGSLAETPAVGAGRWTLANATWLRIVVGVLGFVVLLWGLNISVSRLIWSFVLIGVLLVVIQVLVGTGRTAVARSDDTDAPPTGPQDTVPLPTGGPA
jgi:hypothetical protein